MATHPPGTIAIPVGELARYSLFAHSLGSLVYPPGTQIAMVQSLSIPRNLNEILRNMTGEWVWFQADDHCWADPYILIQLLDRDLDVVCPLMVRRRPPFAPVLFKSQNEDGEYEPFAYDELPDSGTLEVFSAGTGGMLVKRRVIDAIREMQGHDRWFEYQQGEIVNEDVEFCRKIRDAGFTIHADMEVHMGHIGNFVAWPYFSDKWGIRFQMGEGPEGAMNAIYVQPGARDGVAA